MTTKKRTERKRKAYKLRRKMERKVERIARQKEQDRSKPVLSMRLNKSATERRIDALSLEIQSLKLKVQTLTKKQQSDTATMTTKIEKCGGIVLGRLNQLYHMIPRPKIPRPW